MELIHNTIYIVYVSIAYCLLVHLNYTLDDQNTYPQVSDSDSDSDMDCDVDSSEPSSGNCPELGSEQEVTDFLITIATGATDHKEILNV